MIARRALLRPDETFGGELESLVDTLAHQARLTRGQAYWLRLAADEITTNIAHHGYRGGDGVIELVAGLDDRLAWIRIEDDAPAFDPRGYAPTAHLASDPTERSVGGLGLLLALTKVDEFRYERVDGRNRNTLAMRRAGSRPRTG